MTKVGKGPLIGNCWRLLRGTLTAVVLGAALVSCGGGGDGNGDSGELIGTGVMLRGTVSTNRVLANNSVDVKASTGEVTNIAVGENGRFASRVMGDGPFLMRVDLGNADFLYGLGFTGTTGEVDQNIHSYTDAVVRNLLANNGQDADSVFEQVASMTGITNKSQVDEVTASMLGIVGLVLDEYGVDGVDLQTASFDANDTGVDRFLDNNPVLINNGQITIIINDPTTNTQSVAASDIDLATDLTAADTAAPSTPMSVRPLLAGDGDIVVVWEPSIDNIGVNAYQVFRDGTLIATTPFPVYTDSGLTAGTAYSYAIVALDAAGNESSASTLETSEPLGTVDSVAPPAPDAVTLIPTNNSIDVSWQHSDISDVSSFNVLRGAAGATTSLLRSVTSTFLLDADVLAGTEYCYQVQAVDGAGNESTPSAIMCTATTGSVVVPTTPPPTSVTPGGIGGDTSITLAASMVQVLESSPSVVIAVNREGGTVGEVAVDYTITGVSATEGQDYSASPMGTLTWADGDGAPKSITVQIASDGETENNETFSVMLSNISGGATFGETTETIVTISDTATLACDTELDTLTISENTVLNLPCYTVPGSISVRAPANLTIAAGVRMEFASGGQITVADGASLTANGTAEQPIMLTGAEALPGFWDGVQYAFSNSAQNSLEHVVIEYAGSSANGDAALHIRANGSFPSRLSVSNVTLRQSAGYGFNIDNGTTLPTFANNVVASNVTIGRVHPSVAGFIAAENTFTDNEENVIEVISGPLTEDATWADIGVAWLMDGVSVSGEWTIAPGNELRFTSGAQVLVSDDGAIIAVGTAAEPILLTGEVMSPGSWDGVQLSFASNNQNRLEHVTIEYGGSSTNGDANLYIRANSSFPARVGVANLTLSNSQTYGFAFDDHTEISQFDNVTSTANVSPGLLSPDTIGSIGTGSDFSGNTEDLLSARSGTVRTAQTWPTTNVPYLLSSVTVSEDLTLSAGSRLVFDEGAQMQVDDDGKLDAQGTAAAPIIFTGAEMVPGYWQGIQFSFSGIVPNVLNHVVVEYGGGGGASASNGNVEMRCNSSFPSALSMDNTMLNNSAGWGAFLDSTGCDLTLGSVSFTANAAGEINM